MKKTILLPALLIIATCSPTHAKPHAMGANNEAMRVAYETHNWSQATAIHTYWQAHHACDVMGAAIRGGDTEQEECMSQMTRYYYLEVAKARRGGVK